MSGATYYQVLGIVPSASADQIKTAYRELVKRYHPDLFHTTEAKKKATEKLRQINEAYAVLGNAERRRRYDQAFVQQPQARPATGSERRGTSAPRREPPPQQQRRTIRFKFPKVPIHFSKRWAAGAFAASVLIAALVYGREEVPRLVTTYVLLEKVEMFVANTPAREGAATGWVPVGQFASVAECAAAIKYKVRKDEQEGSEAVYDERQPTIAITLHINKEAASAAQPSQSHFTKRVRSLECRANQRVVMESRFRRAWRRLGG